MKNCARGAIVSHGELKVLAAAVELAIEFVKIDINSLTRPNRADHDAEYKQWARSIKESLRIYQNLARKLRKSKTWTRKEANG